MGVPNTGTPTLVTGVKNVHAAEMLSDVQGGSASYETPSVRLTGVTDSLDVTDNVNQTTYYGDDSAAATAQAKGVMDVTISKQNLDDAQHAFLMGNTIENGYVLDNAQDNPPYVALQYELSLDNGGAKFVQLDKVQFRQGTQGGSTKTDTVEFQALNLVGQAVARLSDGRRKRTRIVDAVDVASVRASFFGNANDASAPALTITTIPSNATTGVVVSEDIVLTASNELLEATVTNGNIQLFKDSDGSEVDLVLTLDATDKIITATHDDLEATTDYTLVVSDDLRDVYGQGISKFVTFTTA